jgi:hypothetical protein
MALFHVETGRNISAAGYAVSTIFLVIRAFVSAAAGGYVAGYFARQSSIFSARVHGFAAVALATLLMTFYFGLPNTGGFKQFINTSTSYVINGDTTLPAGAPPQVPFPEAAGAMIVPPPPGTIIFPAGFRRASAGTFLLIAVLTFEALVTAYWAGGEGYLRQLRRLGLYEDTREQPRAA